MPEQKTDDEVSLNRRGYSLGTPVGEGSYAVVRTAYNKNMQVNVALKIVDLEKSPSDFVTKFFPREMEILKAVKHPNIVRVYEIFPMGSKMCIAMELAKNGDLLEYIRSEQRLPEHRARFFLRQIVEAVRYLHRRDIIHRDLKCENILLDDYYNPKITDFGFARYLRPDEESKTFCGSAAYAAPEILRAQPYTGFAYDLWSVGVILYIMVTGRMPFDDSNLRQMRRAQEQRRVTYSRRRPPPSVDCRALITHLLEPDIKKRADADEVIKSRFVGGIPHHICVDSEDAKMVLEGRKTFDGIPLTPVMSQDSTAARSNSAGGAPADEACLTKVPTRPPATVTKSNKDNILKRFFANKFKKRRDSRASSTRSSNSTPKGSVGTTTTTSKPRGSGSTRRESTG